MTAAVAPPSLVKMLDDDTPPDRTMFAAVVALAGQWRGRYRAEMARRGFAWHLSAAGELFDLLPGEGVSQSALTAASGLTKQAVQQLLDHLERQGILRRDPDPADKRARRIVLTDHGLAALSARAAVLAELEAETRDRLGRKAFKKLRRTVRDLAGPTAS